MPSKIHSIAAIVHRFGDSADLSVRFENHRANVGTTQQFQRRSQSRRSGAGNDRNL